MRRGGVLPLPAEMAPARLAVKSRFSNLHGGYIQSGSFEGAPVFSKELQPHDVRRPVLLFRATVHDKRRWHFGPSLPTGGSFSVVLTSSRDAESPEAATWPADSVARVWTPQRGGAGDAALFKDPEFPPVRSSIGAMALPFPETPGPSWVPARQLQEGKWKLFDGIEPADLLQGAVGDCWLLAAIAALAEFPREVRSIFGSSHDIEKSGRYSLRLFDHSQGRMRDITIDEYIPCQPLRWWDETGVPLFAKPNGNEAWVLLLEKAMAKMFGGYARLNGGNAAVAFRAMTGEKNQLMWKKEPGGTWSRWSLVDRDSRFVSEGRERRSGHDLFRQLAEYDRSNFLMSVSMNVRHGMEHKRRDGLVEGHAYTLLQVVEVEGHKLLCLRNPWGNSVEWNGAWSDTDSIWDRYPRLRDRLRPSFSLEDGLFWMCWEDFASRWDSVMVCPKCMRTEAEASKHSNASLQGLGDRQLSRTGTLRPINRLPTPGSLKDLQAQPAGLLDCPGGHGLAIRQAADAFVCDVCSVHRRRGSTVHSCSACDYDVCESCVARAQGVKKAQSPTRPSFQGLLGRLAPSATGLLKRVRGGRGGEDEPKLPQPTAPQPAAPQPSTPQPAAPQQPAALVVRAACPGGHQLQLGQAAVKGFSCDSCGAVLPRGANTFSCRACDFDVCLPCACAPRGAAAHRGATVQQRVAHVPRPGGA